MGKFKVKDHFYEKAKKENFLARSIYKLQEIDKKYRVLSKGNAVLDLGYHPGSWIQYSTEVVGTHGRVVGIDLQPVNKKLAHLKNLSLYQADIFSIDQLSDLEADSQFDTVLSDMAPSTTGIRSVDQDRSLNLVEKVFTLFPIFLKKGGNMVIKVFDGHDAQIYLKQEGKKFDSFQYLKPESTRRTSKEFFVIGKGFRG
ncbi:MAG: RlmE family RNA methyltransferase [Bdellovibrionales bacterium]|jgi:23S rRNA (uridine2552-2'-O)-methyltransferase|nr:RlmE family RNA methyltransferase [Bdellovibrionales bacterium]MBT3526081.1 RlmE family RNA methyltransferase [Bdellovibrionales bacterium]MBT7670178.1 RlmE family RNA methyltransferase [Bdellovibrionales bacterium]MBT7766882.1 RlmE family RNA methyltransferase [Bdellovibrionales bacterium]